MFNKFLLTGATGFLGNTIAWSLHQKGYYCRALVMPGDTYVSKLPPDVELYYGNLLDTDSLEGFFDNVSETTCLIHCAGIVSIASASNPMIHKVNVTGTRNILRQVANHNVGRMIYVSSIHAIPEKATNEIMTEIDVFNPCLVKGEYAQSKAIASQVVLQAAQAGLNVSIVHPSGIIGPGDWRHGQITSTIMSYCKGKLPAGVRGGNNFVDVRDVAEGILACAEYGSAGECYILSGHCATVKTILEYVRKLINGKQIMYLPLQLIKIIAPLYERIVLFRHQVPFLTPYSAYALGSNANYSYEKASKAFGYTPRRLEETIEDTVMWLVRTRQIKEK